VVLARGRRLDAGRLTPSRDRRKAGLTWQSLDLALRHPSAKEKEPHLCGPFLWSCRESNPSIYRTKPLVTSRFTPSHSLSFRLISGGFVLGVDGVNHLWGRKQVMTERHTPNPFGPLEQCAIGLRDAPENAPSGSRGAHRISRHKGPASWLTKLKIALLCMCESSPIWWPVLGA
jgi:hypothetical protein